MNNLKSTPIVVCAICFATLIVVNFMAFKAGFFNTEFAVITVYLCRDILLGILTHQERTDEIASSPTSNEKNPTPPNSTARAV